ncbi:unnamed protein product [Calypogeia fissa]
MESQHRSSQGIRRRHPSPVFRLSVLLLLYSGLVANASEFLEENESVKRFREYLQIPTVHPDPHYEVAIEWLRAQASEIGLPTTIVELVPKKPILYMTWEGSNPSLPSILLNSHMDVVPVEREKWKYDPFEAYMEENGDIYARGSQDDKVVGIQHLEAIRRLRAQGYTPVRTVRVIFVPDEEIGSADGWGTFIDSEQFLDLNVGVMLDEGRCSENSTSYLVGHAEKSHWSLVIKAVGEPAHGSLLTDNTAMENLQKSFESIARFRDSQFNLVKAGLAEQTDVVSINGVYLKAGTPSGDEFAMNVQPSEAEAGFDIRLPPIAGIGAYLDKRIAEEWAPACRNLTYFTAKSNTENGEPPITIADDSNPWWVLVGKAVSTLDATIIPDVAIGATDSRFVRVKGIPSFGFTPVQNVPFLMHAHNEFMNAWEFLKGITVFEQVIRFYGNYTGDDRSNQMQEHSKSSNWSTVLGGNVQQPPSGRSRVGVKLY